MNVKTFELAKMGVSPKAKSLGINFALCNAAIKRHVKKERKSYTWSAIPCSNLLSAYIISWDLKKVTGIPSILTL
jgi:hypothetical protein